MFWPSCQHAWDPDYLYHVSSREAESASCQGSPVPLHSLQPNNTVSTSCNKACWCPSSLGIDLTHWFFRNKNMLGFLLATQHHSHPAMPPEAWRTYSLESLANRFLGWICIRSGRWRRGRRHNFLLCTGRQTHGFYQMTTKGYVANAKHFPTIHLSWSDRQFWSYRQWVQHKKGLWETQTLPHLILTETLWEEAIPNPILQVSK